MSTRRQLMRNERHRWSYMTEQQLHMRLAKITRSAKLECFIEMAIARGSAELRRRAIRRAERLGYSVVINDYTQSVQLVSTPDRDVPDMRRAQDDGPLRVPDEHIPESRLPSSAEVVNEEYDSLLNLHEDGNVLEDEVKAMREESRRQKGVRKIRFRARDAEPHQPKLVDLD